MKTCSAKVSITDILYTFSVYMHLHKRKIGTPEVKRKASPAQKLHGLLMFYFFRNLAQRMKAVQFLVQVFQLVDLVVLGRGYEAMSCLVLYLSQVQCLEPQGKCGWPWSVGPLRWRFFNKSKVTTTTAISTTYFTWWSNSEWTKYFSISFGIPTWSLTCFTW